VATLQSGLPGQQKAGDKLFLSNTAARFVGFQTIRKLLLPPHQQPDRIVPAERNWRHEVTDGAAEYTFPAYSFTVIRRE